MGAPSRSPAEGSSVTGGVGVGYNGTPSDTGMALFDQAAKLVEPARMLAIVGIVIGIAVTLARGVWFFAVSPDAERVSSVPSAPQEAAPRVDVERIAAAHLFGRPGSRTASAAALDRTPDTKLNLVLAAVFEASDPAASVAVIGTGGRAAEVYRVGDAIPGGARLAEVHSDLVVISRGGVREALRFNDLPLTAAAEDTPQEPAIARPTPERSPPDATFGDAPRYRSQTGSVPAVRAVVDAYRSRLQDNPEQALSDIGLQAVSPSETRGYRVGSLASAPQLAQTGLQAGDVIVSVNGRPVGDVQRDRMEIDNVLAAGVARLEVQRGDRRFFVQASLR